MRTRPLGERHPWVFVLVLAALLLTVSACTASPNPEVGTAPDDGEVAGFLLGLWHGVIAPITFIASLLVDGIGVYEVHNSGAWYDGGFVLGLGFIVGGSSHGATR